MTDTIKASDDTEPGDAEISVRLAFESAGPRHIQQWVNMLAEAGLSVIGSTARSIDLRGKVPDIESALDTKVSIEGGKVPSIGDIGRKIGSRADSPLAYVPQKPRYFR